MMIKERKIAAKKALDEFKKLESEEIFERETDVFDIAKLEDTISRLNKRNGELKEKLNAPTDERLAEAYEKIAKLEEEIKRLRRNSLIGLTDAEEKELKEWKSKHLKESSGCMRMRLKFMPFAKGRDNVEVMCNICGATHKIR